MSNNKLFSTKQFGFIPGRSTSLQLLTMLDTITDVVDSNGQVDVIYMDFMKAFDQVPHKRLLKKSGESWYSRLRSQLDTRISNGSYSAGNCQWSCFIMGPSN